MKKRERERGRERGLAVAGSDAYTRLSQVSLQRLGMHLPYVLGILLISIGTIRFSQYYGMG